MLTSLSMLCLQPNIQCIAIYICTHGLICLTKGWDWGICLRGHILSFPAGCGEFILRLYVQMQLEAIAHAFERRWRILQGFCRGSARVLQGFCIGYCKGSANN